MCHYTESLQEEKLQLESHCHELPMVVLAEEEFMTFIR